MIIKPVKNKTDSLQSPLNEPDEEELEVWNIDLNAVAYGSISVNAIDENDAIAQAEDILRGANYDLEIDYESTEIIDAWPD